MCRRRRVLRRRRTSCASLGMRGELMRDAAADRARGDDRRRRFARDSLEPLQAAIAGIDVTCSRTTTAPRAGGAVWWHRSWRWPRPSAALGGCRHPPASGCSGSRRLPLARIVAGIESSPSARSSLRYRAVSAPTLPVSTPTAKPSRPTRPSADAIRRPARRRQSPSPCASSTRSRRCTPAACDTFVEVGPGFGAHPPRRPGASRIKEHISRSDLDRKGKRRPRPALQRRPGPARRRPGCAIDLASLVAGCRVAQSTNPAPSRRSRPFTLMINGSQLRQALPAARGVPPRLPKPNPESRSPEPPVVVHGAGPSADAAAPVAPVGAPVVMRGDRTDPRDPPRFELSTTPGGPAASTAGGPTPPTRTAMSSEAHVARILQTSRDARSAAWPASPEVSPCRRSPARAPGSVAAPRPTPPVPLAWFQAYQVD